MLNTWLLTSQRVSDPRESKAESTMSFRHSLRGHTPSFPQYPVGYTGQFYSVWERTRQEHKYQDVMITGSQLEAGYHTVIVTEA